MNKTGIEKWLDESEENRRLYAQEDLILEVTEAIWEHMEKVGLTKKEVADKMDRSQAYISQILNGSRNMTLRTLADIAYALNIKPKFKFDEENEVFSQQVIVESSEPFTNKPVIVAGQENQWSGVEQLYPQKLRAVA